MWSDCNESNDLHKLNRGKRADLDGIREAIFEHKVTFQATALNHLSIARCDIAGKYGKIHLINLLT